MIEIIKKNKKEILISLFAILYYIIIYNSNEIFGFFGISSLMSYRNNAGITYYNYFNSGNFLILFSSIFLLYLLYLFIKIIKENLKVSKTIKDLLFKASMFTISTTLSFLLLLFFVSKMIFKPSMEAGILLFWFSVGFIVANLFYYLTIITYKIVLRK